MPAGAPIDGRWLIPAGWSWRRARDFAKIVGGSTPKNAADPSNYDAAGTPWLTPADLSGYSKANITSGRRNLAAHVVSRSSLLPAGSVLISSRAPVGYCVVAANAMATNQGFRSLVLNDGIDPYFIRYYVLYSRAYFEDHASGTTFKELSGTALGDLVFPIPPIEMQRHIVARIDELFAEIGEGEAALGRAREDLGTWRSSLLKAAVTGELTADWRVANPPTETGADLLARILVDRRAHWEADTRNPRKRYKEPALANGKKLSALPDGWSWATMEQLSWASGYGSSEKCSAEAMGTPVLRIPNIRGGVVRFDNMKFTVSPMDIRDGNAVDVGDLLIIRTNGSEDLIGRAALVMKRPDVTTYFASYLIRLRLLGPRQLLRWIAVLVNSPVFRAAVLRSIASSAGQFNLNLTKIEGFALPIPPIDEIEVAISRFEAAEDQANAGAGHATEAADTAASLRQSILAAAFRGELA